MTFFRKREIWLPTWPTFLSLAAALTIIGILGTLRLHSFLAVTNRVTANVLVVEGWAPDHVIRAAREEFHRGNYELLVASGGPITQGGFLSGHGTYAKLAATTLEALGFPTNQLLVAPAPKTPRHRTFYSALSVRQQLQSKGIAIRGLNIVTEGVHARRTRRVYEALFQPATPVGVIAEAPDDYEPAKWYTTSRGVKATISEALGWLYEWLFSSGRDPEAVLR